MGPRPGPQHEIEGHIELQEADGKAIWANDLFAAHDDCATLIASLALSLRIAADSLSRPSAASRSPSGAGGAAPEEQPLIVQGVSYLPPPFIPMVPSLFLSRNAVPASEEQESIDLPSLSVWVGAATLFGAAPTVPIRLSLSIGAAWPSVSVSTEIRGALPASGEISGNHLEVTRWDAAFLPCAHKTVFFGCVILSAGGVLGKVSGNPGQNAASFRAGAGLRGGYLIPISRFLTLAFHADLEFSPSPVKIELDDFTSWEESVIQGAVSVSAAGSFPGLPN